MAARGAGAAAGDAGDRISQRTPAAGFAYIVDAFRQGLNDAGFVEGKNVAIEYRWADNQLDRLPGLAADLVRRQVAAIVATGTAARRRPKPQPRRRRSYSSSEPTRSELGLVASLNRPGGNVTGVVFISAALAAKLLGLLHELVPKASVIAVLRDPNDPEFEAESRDLEEAARAIGRQILMVNAATRARIQCRLRNGRPSGRRRAAHRQQPILPQPTPTTRGAGGRVMPCRRCIISASTPRLAA